MKPEKKLITQIPFLLLLLNIIFISSFLIGNVDAMLLRNISGIVLVIFSPGYLILRIMDIELDNLKYLIVSVGLSLFFLMSFGLGINFVYPIFGYRTPLSENSIVFSIFFVLLILIAFSIKKENKFPISLISKVKDSKFILLLSFFPLLAFFGAKLMNLCQINALNILLIISLSIVPFLVVYYCYFQNAYKNDEHILIYSLFVVSLSLFLYTSLTSNYLFGSDIHADFLVCRKTWEEGIWGPSTPHTGKRYDMLGITILPTIISKVSGINPIWIYKTIYPIFAALIPVSLFGVYQHTFREKIAFLSSFLYTSLYAFYWNFWNSPRMMLAVFFFSLFLLSSYKLNMKRKGRLISISFLFGMVWSHYGTTYFYIPTLLLSIFVAYFLTKSKKNWMSNILKKRNLGLLCIFTFFWYYYPIKPGPFTHPLMRNIRILIHEAGSFLNPASTRGVTMASEVGLRQGILHNITTYLILAILFFAGIYLLKIVIDRLRERKIKHNLEFTSISLISGVTGAAIILYPRAPFTLGRPLLLIMIFLAPFGLTGMGKLITFLFSSSPNTRKSIYLFFSLFLSLFLLLNSGVIYKIGGEKSNLALDRSTYPPAVFKMEEYRSAIWSKKLCEKNIPVYGDRQTKYLRKDVGIRKTFHFARSGDFPNKFYIYLREVNINERLFAEKKQLSSLENEIIYEKLLISSKVYSNSKSEIYLFKQS